MPHLLKVLALDQALVTTGYAIIDLEVGTITFGEIQSPKRRGKIEYLFWERVQFIRDRVSELLTQYNCSHLILEQPYISRHQHMSHAQSLQSVYGALQLLGLDVGVPVSELTPTQWPKLIGLTTTKQELLQELQPYGVTSDHQSDAIGLGLAYLVKSEALQVNINRCNFLYQRGNLYKLGERQSTSKVFSLPAAFLPEVC